MKNIVDFLKLPPRILGALSVASGLLLFLPNVIIEKLYMTSFRDKYGFAILIKNSIFRNSLIFQGLPPIKYQNLMYFPLFLPL